MTHGGSRHRLVAMMTAVAVWSLLPALATADRLSVAPDGRGKVAQEVLKEVASSGSASFWVLLRARADLSAAPSIRSWSGRGTYVMRRLIAVANRTQRRLRSVLEARALPYRSFWAANAILVTRAGTQDVATIAVLPEVATILPRWNARVDVAAAGRSPGGMETIEWNVKAIRAQRVWNRFDDRGDGIVVANIDTGVKFDHPALVRQYRGNEGGGTFNHAYDWFDPSHECPKPRPCDEQGHGTETMGIAVGDDGDPGTNRIGAAPHARWIAAKGCTDISCTDVALVASGQWMLAPTNLDGRKPRPDLRPDVVNNSWSSARDDDFYAQIVQDWVASGIFPVFSVGASGPSCGTVGAPASYPESYGVGAFDMDDRIAGFSGRGPSPFGGAIKPNVAAPGVSIRTSSPPDGYTVLSGTSMASPQVAATVALMWSAQPLLRRDVAATRSILDATAVDHPDVSCGGDPANNNVWGEGRLDAFAAVRAARASGDWKPSGGRP